LEPAEPTGAEPLAIWWWHFSDKNKAAQNGRIEERIAEGQMEVALARLRGELSTGDDQNEAK
jgi:hypothetical protein